MENSPLSRITPPFCCYNSYNCSGPDENLTYQLPSPIRTLNCNTGTGKPIGRTRSHDSDDITHSRRLPARLGVASSSRTRRQTAGNHLEYRRELHPLLILEPPPISLKLLIDWALCSATMSNLEGLVTVTNELPSRQCQCGQ